MISGKTQTIDCGRDLFPLISHFQLSAHLVKNFESYSLTTPGSVLSISEEHNEDLFSILHVIHLRSYVVETDVKTGGISNAFISYLAKILYLTMDFHRVQPIVVENHIDAVIKSFTIL